MKTPKTLTPEKAVEPLRSGQRIFVGSGAAEPQRLVSALAARGESLHDAEVLHLLTLGQAPYAQERFAGRLRHNALFIGPNVRGAVARGLADYTPCFLHEVPELLRSRRLPVDAALIEVSPPRDGAVSLGISVDVVKAAVEAAPYVVAQVNRKMPWTLGDSLIPLEDIDAIVEHDEPLLTLPAAESKAAALWIGRYVAGLVSDGDTIQVGIGSIPDEVLSALAGKRDLGVHSEMISDGVLELWRRGVATGARKSVHPGKIIASFAMGSRALYEALDGNPAFAFYPSDYVNDPRVVATNDRLVSINSALQVDLTGQVCADSIGPRFYSGFGGQVDFIRGAAWSRGGRSVIALPATAKAGQVSRIVATLAEGSGVVTSRADVDFVVTEFGIASLKGRTIRERAVALIQIAHPAHRPALEEAAARLGYIDAGHVLPRDAGPYRVELEVRRRFERDELFFRPLRPSDEKRLKRLFYSQSAETTYRRFGAALNKLSERQFQELVAIDFVGAVAIGGFVREGRLDRLIAVGRFFVEPGGATGEAAFTVHDDYQGQGIGSFLVDYLSWIAKGMGLQALTAEVLAINSCMRKIFQKRFKRLHETEGGGSGSVTMLLSDWKGDGNPALEGTALHA